ncbi:SDR family oxidoreductase [Rhizorhabdus wittichii]|uniref:SDR family oxidoreductase n=1 Tax=Rhizorhabdus wittichii TaxID=160791 RepID=A0A975D1I7_9SPHN|nr:SDR family oxidoreductase [Rhizorhabdus wittichii]QTH21183.1 SDR family oxidoreductase [Rhizorhabdus wittichii]
MDSSARDRIVPGRFAGKRAMVTGGSRGIGAAVARRLGAEGALVAIAYRSRSHEAEEIASGIVDGGGQAFAIQTDIGLPGAIDSLFAAWDETATGITGDNRLDILVNNAGIASAAALSEIQDHAFDRIFAINTKGSAFVSQQAVRRMTQGGRIVSIGSGAAKQPGPLNGTYGMSKAALLAMTRSLAVELGQHGITANVVAPGYTRTDMTAHMLAEPRFVERLEQITALRRVGEPEDIAAVVCFLASDDGGWLTGQWIEATGGYKLVPPV